MLNITNHQRNANKKTAMRYDLIPVRILASKGKEKVYQVLARIYGYASCGYGMPHYYSDVSHITFVLQLTKWGIGSYLWNSLAFHIPSHLEATKHVDCRNEVLKWVTPPYRLGSPESKEMYSWSF